MIILIVTFKCRVRSKICNVVNITDQYPAEVLRINIFILYCTDAYTHNAQLIPTYTHDDKPFACHHLTIHKNR